ncbi:hypothetical protein [Tautonia marina]|uniref:hypothetical protein n=1 Tax=Tautonia marina TaxID=2653855 RepID=UPI001260770E|nr:hypothetical protein [Tautonia marina]
MSSELRPHRVDLRRRRTRSVILPLVIFLPPAVLGGGCSPPQVDPEHRELILRLATATSARDSQLLEAVAEDLKAHRAAGTLGGAQHAAFEAIVTAGRTDDWDQAQRRAYALRDAQRPTQAEVDRLKSRPLPPPKRLNDG